MDWGEVVEKLSLCHIRISFSFSAVEIIILNHRLGSAKPTYGKGKGKENKEQEGIIDEEEKHEKNWEGKQ